ncbi:MAG: hypothetical protein M0Z95_22660 [Actinomycetota bacterium]|nr:hypothetical protein [Actinomycetota bacterium]
MSADHPLDPPDFMARGIGNEREHPDHMPDGTFGRVTQVFGDAFPQATDSPADRAHVTASATRV